MTERRKERRKERGGVGARKGGRKEERKKGRKEVIGREKGRNVRHLVDLGVHIRRHDFSVIEP
jgi:hypothetical protein